ncbi:MAG: glycoside hydrolase family 2 TIM barrel-domain containing protein [Chloroflexota bacterium]|nr:glycoside hydrolase family 2 TIM barrel-domain containing protein [Chloroflexota bacterium]
MRAVHNFNQGWLYAPRELSHHTPDSDFLPVTLPHSNAIVPHHNFDVSAYAFVSTYRKRFTLPEAANGRRVFLDFEGVMISSQVWINGHYLGEHDGGYTPFSYDITEHLQDGENVLQVRVDSTERPDIPPFGFIVDYLTFGGIYRDVALRYVEPIYIKDVFVRTIDVLGTAPSLEVDVWVANTTADTVKRTITLGIEITDSNRDLQSQVIELAAGQVTKLTLTAPVNGFALWSLTQPQMYTCVVGIDDARADELEVRFGFREAEFRSDGFYLNGEKIKLRGVNRHQNYPYIGAAAPVRLQRKDADIVKYELGCNIVRTSHYPQSPHFIERCDEIGLLVFEEIPGWQNIGDSDWKALSLRDVQAMIERDRNHPSIILWGVRINESWDDEGFYRLTNEIAHRYDPTRQTGGVRYFQESQFLEDVFTFNDFSNSVQEPKNTPHLVTEYMGHMFPTKTYDGEERQVEHALRHAKIQDKMMGMDNVTGAIAWCMFDYNTHVEFGSGDRICYHGIMDMWRLPKFAAALYESQIDPSEHIVLRPATFYAFGDKSNGGGDQDFDYIIFSNCDELEIYLGNDLLGRYQPDRAHFPHLLHPPFRIGDGQMWYTHRLRVADARIVGYRNGAAVAEEHLTTDKLPQQLILTADDATLHADGTDMTRLVFKLVDKYGHRLPHAHAVATFTLEGEADLIGVNPFPLVGGQAGMYLKARRTAGVVTVRATAAPFGLSAEVKVALE